MEAAQIKTPLLQAQREGPGTSNAAIVSRLKRRNAKVPLIRVQEVRSEPGRMLELRPGRSVGRMALGPGPPGPSFSTKPRQRAEVENVLDRIELVASARVAETGLGRLLVGRRAVAGSKVGGGAQEHPCPACGLRPTIDGVCFC